MKNTTTSSLKNALIRHLISFNIKAYSVKFKTISVFIKSMNSLNCCVCLEGIPIAESLHCGDGHCICEGDLASVSNIIHYVSNCYVFAFF